MDPRYTDSGVDRGFQPICIGPSYTRRAHSRTGVTSASASGIRAILLDIEGTTTPIAFVKDVLFPFARAHLAGFLGDARNAAITAEVTSLLKREHEEERRSWRLTAALDELDPGRRQAVRRAVPAFPHGPRSKSPGLKLLQGHIWERGYRDGELQGECLSPMSCRPSAAGVTPDARWQSIRLAASWRSGCCSPRPRMAI